MKSNRSQADTGKKTDEFKHVGLLCNEPSGKAGLSLI